MDLIVAAHAGERRVVTDDGLVEVRLADAGLPG
jgi:hypothetical protein